MALRTEKAFGVILAAALAHAAWGQSFEFQAKHDHWRKGCAGTLRIDTEGATYTGEKQHSWTWAWQDIQRFELSPTRINVLTYKDNRWKLGADREYAFSLAPDQSVGAAYGFLKDRLDQRFVARLADPEVKPLWETPAKRLGRLRGSEGALLVGEDRIVFRSEDGRESMTWRLTDIQNLSSSGPFQLTLATLQETYEFQLKQPLEERRYDALWRAIEQRHGRLAGLLAAP
ncbi:MAG TPA: hypothetical protein VLH09_03605 [Bryobacteraceae bacterium]|nr:hypothetical protein [Bryobacteraceae bacterium]